MDEDDVEWDGAVEEEFGPQGIDWLLECDALTEDVLVSCGALPDSGVTRVRGRVEANALANNEALKPIVDEERMEWTAWAQMNAHDGTQVHSLWNAFKQSCYMMLQEEAFDEAERLQPREVEVARSSMLELQFEVRCQSKTEVETFSKLTFLYRPFEASCSLGSVVSVDVSKECDRDTEKDALDFVNKAFRPMDNCFRKHWNPFAGSFGGVSSVHHFQNHIQKSPLSPESVLIFADAIDLLLSGYDSKNTDLSVKITLQRFEDYKATVCPLWLVQKMMLRFGSFGVVMLDFVLRQRGASFALSLQNATALAHELRLFEVSLPISRPIPRSSWSALTSFNKHVLELRTALRKRRPLLNADAADQRVQNQLNGERSRESFITLLCCLKRLSIPLPLDLRRLLWHWSVEGGAAWRVHGHLVLSRVAVDGGSPTLLFRCLGCIRLCDLTYHDALTTLHPVARLCPVHRALVLHHHYDRIKEPSAKEALLYSPSGDVWHYSDRFPRLSPPTLVPHSWTVTPGAATGVFPVPCYRARVTDQIWVFSDQNINDFWFGDDQGVQWESENTGLC